MVKLFQRHIPHSAILDFVVESGLCLLAFFAVVHVAWWGELAALPHDAAVRSGKALTSVLVLIGVLYVAGYFERRHRLRDSLYVPRLLQAVPLAALSLGALYLLAPPLALPWMVAGSALLLTTLLMMGWHTVASSVIDPDRLAERVLVLGEGELAVQIARRMDELAPGAARLVGYVPIEDSDSHGTDSHASDRVGARPPAASPRAWAAPGHTAHARVVAFPVPVRVPAASLGRIEDLEEILRYNEIHAIVVALADRRGKLPLGSLIRAKLRGVTVYDAVDFYERMTGRMMVPRLRPSAIIFSEGFAPTRFTLAAKRAIDLAAAGGLLLLSAPVQLVVAAVIRLTSSGPALFRQERVGLAGESFTIFKFRTMREDAEKDGPQWASEDDDRVTPVGRFLRKSRLDELPQLFNVIAGHMSFVGPRPERPVFVDELREAIPYYDQRHTVRPGLTGWAQVKYPYGASIEETEEKLEYDLYYIKWLSAAFDLTIILETVRVLLTGKGAR